MSSSFRNRQFAERVLIKTIAAFSLGATAFLPTLHAQNSDAWQAPHFYPGNLVVSRSVYDNNPANVKVGEVLPPNCAGTQGGCAGSSGATNNGSYPYVFNNDIYDGSFGITSRIYLDQIDPFGYFINSLQVPNSLEKGVSASS